ncbi:MAG: hypothetical protein U5K00_22980 [Melioribacteraceae bacterium]|nr:hypothetical protein [Melioribacteraceae bacterium]
MRNNIAVGGVLFFYGMLSLLSFFNILNVDYTNQIAFTLLLFGLLSVLTALNKLKRSSLLLISILFNTGFILFIHNNYEILNEYYLVLSIILFMTGSGFLLIFLQNTLEKTPLYISVFFLVLAFTSAVFYKSNVIIQFANRITLILFDLWPVFLIVFGILLVAGKSKRI